MRIDAHQCAYFHTHWVLQYFRFDCYTNGADSRRMNLKALRKAIEIAGGQAALGRMISASPRQVSNWVNREGRAAARYCVPIERATNGEVTCYMLRPDIFPADQKRVHAEPNAAARSVMI